MSVSMEYDVEKRITIERQRSFSFPQPLISLGSVTNDRPIQGRSRGIFLVLRRKL